MCSQGDDVARSEAASEEGRSDWNRVRCIFEATSAKRHLPVPLSQRRLTVYNLSPSLTSETGSLSAMPFSCCGALSTAPFDEAFRLIGTGCMRRLGAPSLVQQNCVYSHAASQFRVPRSGTWDTDQLPVAIAESQISPDDTDLRGGWCRTTIGSLSAVPQ